MLKCNITAIYMIIYNLQHIHTNYANVKYHCVILL